MITPQPIENFNDKRLIIHLLKMDALKTTSNSTRDFLICKDRTNSRALRVTMKIVVVMKSILFKRSEYQLAELCIQRMKKFQNNQIQKIFPWSLVLKMLTEISPTCTRCCKSFPYILYKQKQNVTLMYETVQHDNGFKVVDLSSLPRGIE